jgi:signal transduction histidine kinase
MKSKPVTSLFFLPLFVIWGFSGICTLNAQNSNDSLRYYYDRIVKPDQLGKIPEAVLYYQKRKTENLKRGDTLETITDLQMIARGLNELGSAYDSQKALVEAVDLIKGFSYKDTLTGSLKSLYNELGISYRNSKNTEGAMAIFNDALELAVTRKESIVLFNNKANIYKDLARYQDAKEQVDLAYTLIEKGASNSIRALVLNNLGFVQGKLDEPNALRNLQTALEIREAENEIGGAYAVHKSLSEYYTDRENTILAKFHVNKALEIARKLNNVSYLRDAYGLYITLNSDSISVANKLLTDSLELDRQYKDVKYAYLKYNVEEEQKRTAESELHTERQKRLKIVYLGGGVLILLGSGFLFYLYRQKYKREKIRQVFETESRISKKVHDEVANDVYHVMTKLQGNSSERDEILDDLEGIYTKTRDISKESSALDVNENFDELLNDLLISYQSEEVNVITKNISKIDWKTHSELKKISIYRVLQELMTNMRKHSEATLVVLTASQSGNKILIKYTDNGVGSDVKKNNGLQNAENRMKVIRGTITFESQINKGFSAIISV